MPFFYKTALLLCSFTFLAPLFPSSEIETLEVRLATEQNMQPLFIAKCQLSHANYSSDYLAQLDQILEDDLKQSGYFQILPCTPERAALAQSSLSDPLNLPKWKSSSAPHVVQAQIDQGSLSLTLLAVSRSALKKMGRMPLSGDLSQDRRQIHLLADMLVKELTGQAGIAATHLLFSHKIKGENNQWISEVWECDSDGYNARKVINAANGYSITPLYIPPKMGCQASAFFFVSYKNGQPKIYLGNLTNGECQRLMPLSGNQLMPTISRKRDKIAFISDITGNPDLFLQDFSPERGLIGKPRQIYATKQATQGSPTFSPDGKRLAFVSNKDGHPRIYLMDIPSLQTPLKEIKTTLISRTCLESTAPCWSPDGEKIAFCAKTDGVRQIWIYDLKNDQERQLTEGGENKENPSWAPDSFHLVYNTTGPRGGELYSIHLNTLKPTKISLPFLKGGKRFPSWEPK